MTDEPLVFSRDLTEPLPAPDWPDGFARLPFNRPTARTAHALLHAAYRNGFGAVSDFEDWYSALCADAEYDAGLCFLYGTAGRPSAFAQVWTSGFIKDLAVAEAHRRKGIGRALLLSVFAEVKARGIATVRLKVVPGNAAAIALYSACGMKRLRD